jgi:2-polyprenyl-3-methyl-5-hydroxy-6-metoxy-1,4-benzoquinol methylase
MERLDDVGKLKWFHAIDFGEFASSGRFPPGSPQNITLYGVFEFLQAMHLDNASVLDLGTYDGIVAFGAKKLGALSVTAVDTYRNPAFLLARELLNFTEDDIEYQSGVQVRDLPALFEPKRFDVIVCAGIFYHMLHPMQAFTECRKVLRDGGYLLLETPFADDREDAVLVFNGTEHVVNEPYTYFVPTESALTGMANLAGYKVVSRRILQPTRRITLLLRAASRESLVEDPETPEFVVQMLKRDTCDDSFRFRDIEAIPKLAVNVGNFENIERHRVINPRDEVVTFPFHPPVGKKTAGSTRFETAHGNTRKL